MTLVELLVCCGLSSLLLLSVYSILAAGTRYYLNSTKTIDLQQSCLVVATSLASELSEGNFRSLVTSPPDGLVFASPRNADGEVEFEGKTLLWRKWVCYYVDKDGDGSKLVRKEEQFSDAADYPPPVPNDRPWQWFKSQSGLASRQMARYIYDVSVTRTYPLYVSIGAEDIDQDFRVAVTTKVKMRN